MNKYELIKGQQIVNERMQLLIEKIEVNRMLGEEKFDITAELVLVGQLVKKYGIGDSDLYYTLSKMVLEDIKEELDKKDESLDKVNVDQDSITKNSERGE